MKRFDDSREELIYQQKTLPIDRYLDWIWFERYPAPTPKASKAWPYVMHVKAPKLALAQKASQRP